ncbi:MAG: thioredoxin family protein [Planctomycetota bacterium]|nr:thioredoxin family protein [Planctomycetota bacterium]
MCRKFLLALALFYSTSASSTAADWLDSYEAAAEKAEKSQKPMLLFYFRANCKQCRKLETSTLADPEVVERLDKFVLARVDVAENLKELLRLKPIGNVTPYIIFTRPDGQQLFNTSGYVPASLFVKRLDQALAKSGS